MSKPYYVTLTGNRNNAGDFLIRHRGHELLRRLRPDRDLVDLDAWEALDGAALERVNAARALILLGGPALRRDMYPAVYPLAEDLDRIRVPIIIMGAGWSSFPGYWPETRRYRFTPPTRDLLGRCLRIGVRDYRSLNALLLQGLDRAVMTGCPALYSEPHLGAPPPPPFAGQPASVVFSQGISFLRSPGADAATRDLILALQTHYPAAELTVAFHHSTDAATLRAAYGSEPPFHARQTELVHWLENRGIAYRDISGGVDRLMDLYQSADLHVGQRVHAHIFCCSVNRPSVLLTEDGRGQGLREVLGGLILDTHDGRSLPTVRERVVKRLGLRRRSGDPYRANAFLGREVIAHLDYEARSGGLRLAVPRGRIDAHYPAMQRFISELP